MTTTTADTFTPATAIQPDPVRWLLTRYIPFGHASVICGKPGTGKTAVCAALVGIVTTSGASRAPNPPTPGHAVIIETRHDPIRTLFPRLVAAGADGRRVTLLRQASTAAPATGIASTSGIASAIAQAREQGEGPVLVVADPVADARTLHKLEEIAQDTGAAIVATTRSRRTANAGNIVLECAPHPRPRSGYVERPADSDLWLQHSILSRSSTCFENDAPPLPFEMSDGAAFFTGSHARPRPAP
jgi:hypothetical protein